MLIAKSSGCVTHVLCCLDLRELFLFPFVFRFVVVNLMEKEKEQKKKRKKDWACSILVFV